MGYFARPIAAGATISSAWICHLGNDWDLCDLFQRCQPILVNSRDRSDDVSGSSSERSIAAFRGFTFRTADIIQLRPRSQTTNSANVIKSPSGADKAAQSMFSISTAGTTRRRVSIARYTDVQFGHGHKGRAINFYEARLCQTTTPVQRAPLCLVV
jgi:hypothetical protein